ncbi:MAG: hypothetical protein R3A44_22480 [Caldilineaceae bacterium]
MGNKTLAEVVSERPFPEYDQWWRMGREFLDFMSTAIVGEWSALPGNGGDLAAVNAHVQEYVQTVFGRTARGGLVDEFVQKRHAQPIQSGEFDALSYAFYRSAFEIMTQNIEQYAQPLARERRLFTQRVGKIFYAQLHDHLKLQLPSALQTQAQFEQLQTGIAAVGEFLVAQGYLRDHFRFTFDVDAVAGQAHIQQRTGDVLANLQSQKLAHALYEMGYAVILPSAVYLYHTLGEAQHHSSRTIEELFARVGLDARETDDFDPINYPSELVVELWEIRA